MEKRTSQSIMAILVMGIVLSFTSMYILTIRFDMDREELVLTQSVLTDANALEWGATPGQRNVTQYDDFQLFTYVDGDFKLQKQKYIYSYNSELKNRTYIPSSPGYIKFLPTFWYDLLEEFSDQSVNINNINLVAIQNFYRSHNQPNLMKIPRRMEMIVRSLEKDFLNYYFTHIIYDFYTNDWKSVQTSIFNPSKIDATKQELLWNDAQYGWKEESSFQVWIKASLQKNHALLQEYFQLTNEQMEGLLGPTSIISKLKKLIFGSSSDGVKSLKKGNCLNEICSMWELAIAQWGFGALTAEQFVPPVVFKQGSFATYNDSIPANYEYYLTVTEPLQFQEAQGLLREEMETNGNLLSFNTMQYVFDNIENPDALSLERIKIKLALIDTQRAIDVSQYLKQQANYIDSITETYAYQLWRSMSKMVDDAGALLRNGLHAKALYYQVSRETCILLIPFPDACDTQYDFTLNAKNALIWVDAYFKGSDSDSFQKLVSTLKITDQTLQGYLQGSFGGRLNAIKLAFSQYYKCNYAVCSEAELFQRQWCNSEITQNYPPELKFFESDKVKTISSWDIYQDKPFVIYELSVFLESTITREQMFKLMNFEMGGIYGYYSLRNLFEFHLEGKTLNPKFPYQGKQAEKLIQYLKHCLINYWYGGHIVNVDSLSYLFDYGNSYTAEKTSWNPLHEGVNWKSTSSQLIRANSDEVMRFANFNDYFQLNTGLKQMDNVGQMIMTFSDSKIKVKRVLYFHDETDYLTEYYYNPYGEEKVSGSYGYAFSPETEQNEIEIFDIDLYQKYTAHYKRNVDYKGYDVRKYYFKNQELDLSNMEGYPLYVTQGTPDFNCANINGELCQRFLEQLPQSEYLIESLTGIAVGFKKVFVYWLNIDEQSPLLQKPFINPTKIPIALRTVSYYFKAEQMDRYFKDVNDLKKQKSFYFYTTLTLGCLFSVAFFAFVYYYITNKNELRNRALSVYSNYSEG